MTPVANEVDEEKTRLIMALVSCIVTAGLPTYGYRRGGNVAQASSTISTVRSSRIQYAYDHEDHDRQVRDAMLKGAHR